MKLLVTGSIAFDYLMSFPGHFSEHFVKDKLDKVSLSFLVEQMNKQKGGCAANIAYTLGLLGERPLLVGAVGQDFAEYRQWLEKAGVDTGAAREFPNVYTASFFANTDLDQNQICSFYTGAMQFAREITLKDWADEEDWVIISPNDPAAMAKYADECREICLSFIYDPSQQIARLSGDDLIHGAKGSEILIVNEYEREMFLQKTGMQEADLFSLTRTLIVTLGDKGACIYHDGKEINIPVAIPKAIQDPTGVGDAFRSGLLKGLANSLSFETSGRLGSLSAAYVLETEGPQCHTFTLKEFITRYKETFGDSLEIEKLVQ